jgi:hypothetical protein
MHPPGGPSWHAVGGFSDVLGDGRRCSRCSPLSPLPLALPLPLPLALALPLPALGACPSAAASAASVVAAPPYSGCWPSHQRRYSAAFETTSKRWCPRQFSAAVGAPDRSSASTALPLLLIPASINGVTPPASAWRTSFGCLRHISRTSSSQPSAAAYDSHDRPPASTQPSPPSPSPTSAGTSTDSQSSADAPWWPPPWWLAGAVLPRAEPHS